MRASQQPRKTVRNRTPPRERQRSGRAKHQGFTMDKPAAESSLWVVGAIAAVIVAVFLAFRILG